jgi:hypothetical protein
MTPSFLQPAPGAEGGVGVGVDHEVFILVITLSMAFLLSLSRRSALAMVSP